MSRLKKTWIRRFSALLLVATFCLTLPGIFAGLRAGADNSVDIDITNWDSWYVYDHYDVVTGGYNSGDTTMFTSVFGDSSTDPGMRPYFPIEENQAVNNGSITTIPALLNTGAWRNVHHLKEHISLVTVPKTGFDIHDIVFMGYGEEPYTDFLIYPETSGGVKSFGYDIYALNIDTHTLSSAGFLLNSGVDASGYIHGYVLLIGFPDTYGGGSFDGARMYLYKINDNVKAEDIHHPANDWSKGAFTNQGSNMIYNQLPAMDLAVDGRTMVLLDMDDDGSPDHLGFRQEGSAADSAIAVIYDDAGSIIAQVMVDGQDITIDENGRMWFYDDTPSKHTPFHLDDSRVSTMEMPMEMSIDDPNVTVIKAKVSINGGAEVEIDGDKYSISREGVSVRSDVPNDPGYPDSYWVGRPGGWSNASFVPGESSVWAEGKKYVLDDDACYMEGNSLYIRDDSGAGQFADFWMESYSIISGSVVLNNAPPVPYNPDTMWLEDVSGFGYLLCMLQPNGLLKTYTLDGIHSYFTTDTLVDLRYGNAEAGILPGTYALDGTEAYLENGYLRIRKNIHYNYVYIDGTTNYVMDGSKFKLQNGQVFVTDGDDVKFQYGNLVISGSRYTYEMNRWDGGSYPTALKIHLTGHEVLPEGDYELGTGGVEWYDGYLAAPVSIYVIDGEDLFIENGKDIKTDGGLLYIFPGGLDSNEPGRVVIESGRSSSRIVETIFLDGTNNYSNPAGTIVHVDARPDRYSYNSTNLTHVGTLTNPGEFFAPEDKKTSVLHLDVAFNDSELTITSSVPGGDGTTKTASIVFNAGQSFASDGTYRGFGPYVEYQSHGCSSLTSFRFSNMTMGAVPQHKVNFDKNTNDPSAAPGATTYIEVDEGSKIGELPPGASPTRPGYDFLGWAKKPYAAAPDFHGEDERMGFDDITVYAVWEAVKVEVTFYYSTPSTPTSLLPEPYTIGNDANDDKYFGDKLTNFADPELAGYIFLGWYDSEDPGGVKWDFAKTIDTGGPIKLYSHWEPITTPGDYITITFDKNGGDPGTITSRLAHKNETGPIALPSAETGDAPTRVGYDFVGWSNTGGDNYGPGFYELVGTGTADIDLYAVWKAKAKVTFGLDGGGFASPLEEPQYPDKGVYELPTEEPSKNGYRFAGWKIDGDTSGKVYDPGEVIDNINDDITFVAQWKPLFTVTVKDSFADPAGGGTYEAGEGVTINAGNGGSDWIFLGWEITSGTASLTDITSKKTTFTMPSGNVTLTAIWHELNASDYSFPVATYEVIFDANGGHPTDTEWVEDGSKVAKPSDPTRTDHKFLGWYTSETGGSLWDFENPITGNTVLYAHWEDLSHPVAETSTVTFDRQDGSPLTSVKVGEGKAAANPGIPTRSGYAFKGWFTAPTGGSEWDFGTVIDRDIHLYAHWEEILNPVTVTFDPQNGSAVSAATVEQGTTVAKPADPTRSGYTFRGWYTAATGGSLWNFATGAVTANTTLYAHWEQTAYGDYDTTDATTPGTTVGTVTPPITDPVGGNTPEPDESDDGNDGDDGSGGLPASRETDQQTGLLLDPPQIILLPEGMTVADFEGIDLNSHQIDMGTPGGTDHYSPPVMNDPDHMLRPEIDENGNIIFHEIDDPDGPPLGYWAWSDEDDMWVFVDAMTPLAQMPQTGLSNIGVWLLIAGTAIVCAAIPLRRAKSAKNH